MTFSAQAYDRSQWSMTARQASQPLTERGSPNGVISHEDVRQVVLWKLDDRVRCFGKGGMDRDVIEIDWSFGDQ